MVSKISNLKLVQVILELLKIIIIKQMSELK